jgi:L-threonylcarbamoyladenylate synthase
MTILREEKVRSSDQGDPDKITVLASSILRSGGVIAYPTETVYGFGCDYLSEEGYQKILELKCIEDGKPFILVIPDVEWVHILSPESTRYPLTRELASKFWPGPLTLILPAASHLPEFIVGSQKMVSMRISPDPFVQALMGRYQRPITSTSANPTGRDPATCISDLKDYFSTHRVTVDLAVDDGERSGFPSTLVRITGSDPVVVREGAIPASQIYSACQT